MKNKPHPESTVGFTQMEFADLLVLDKKTFCGGLLLTTILV